MRALNDLFGVASRTAIALSILACGPAPPPRPSPPLAPPSAVVLALPAPQPTDLPPPREQAPAPDDPPPAPRDDLVRDAHSIGDRTVSLEARLDAGGGGVSLLVTVEEKGHRLSTLTPGVPFSSCGRVDVAIEGVQGAPSPLVLAQHFCEQGEDELTREIQAFVIHVGDASSPPRVLWSGGGTFRSSFGVCDQIDVPVARVVRAGRLLVEQWTEVVARPNPRHLGGTEPCPARRESRRKLLETSF